VAIGYIIILLETPSPFHQRLLFDPLGILVSACLLVAIEMSVVATKVPASQGANDAFSGAS